MNTPHLLPGSPCPPCGAPISKGSTTVYVNGQQCGRIGDPTCTAVAMGSANTFAGG